MPRLASGGAAGLGRAVDRTVLPGCRPTWAAYIGTEAASALTMHLTKIATYGAGDLRTGTVWLYGAALTPATLLGAWVGQKNRGPDQRPRFILLVEISLLAEGMLRRIVKT